MVDGGARRIAKQCETWPRSNGESVFPGSRTATAVFIPDESQQAQTVPGGHSAWVVGEGGRGPRGPIYWPKGDFEPLLAFAMRSNTGAPRTDGLVLTGQPMVPNRQDSRGFLASLAALVSLLPCPSPLLPPGPLSQGPARSKKSLWNQRWGGCGRRKGPDTCTPPANSATGGLAP